MVRIIAIDPGVTTGIAIRMEDKTIFTKVERDLEVIYELLSDTCIIVYEDFQTAFRIDKNGLHTVRLIGSIIALGWSHNNLVYKYTPFKRKAFQEQAHQFLKGIKHMIHEEDALAHLLAYEVTGS